LPRQGSDTTDPPFRKQVNLLPTQYPPHLSHPIADLFPAAFADYFRDLPTLISAGRRSNNHPQGHPSAARTATGNGTESAHEMVSTAQTARKSLVLKYLTLNPFVFKFLPGFFLITISK
jgi:hypothetical protein